MSNEVGDWQPMDCAPKDGTVVDLLVVSDVGRYIAKRCAWTDGAWTDLARKSATEDEIFSAAMWRLSERYSGDKSQ